MRVEAAGVNFIDVYHRTGLYKVSMPLTLGREGAGVVEAVGSRGHGPAPGDRVAWDGVARRLRREGRRARATASSGCPDGVTTRQAAAAMLQGMTAHYLTRSTYPLKPGDVCLVHAAAGGVGLLLCQIGEDARRARARDGLHGGEGGARPRGGRRAHDRLHGAGLRGRGAKRSPSGRGVDVVYDSVGKTTFEKSLACLRPARHAGALRAVERPGPAHRPARPQQKGSLYLTRPTLGHYTATRAELLARAGDVLAWVRQGRLRLRIAHEFPLREAAAAHRALEGRADDRQGAADSVGSRPRLGPPVK